MDEVIFEEFKGTGESRDCARSKFGRQTNLAGIDTHATGTRREEVLFEAEEYRRVNLLRRMMSELNSADAMEQLTTKLLKTQSNAEFLLGLKLN